jgi:hypothetical protein
LELLSDKCWFCKKEFEVNAYNDHFVCKNHDLVINLQTQRDGYFQIYFEGKHNTKFWATSWQWESNVNTGELSDFNTVVYNVIRITTTQFDLNLLKLLEQPWEDVYCQLQLFELFS